MTRTETTELNIYLEGKDAVQAFDCEFSNNGAVMIRDAQGNRTTVAFCKEHIPAIEQLLAILYAYRGDYDDVMHPQLSERIAA